MQSQPVLPVAHEPSIVSTQQRAPKRARPSTAQRKLALPLKSEPGDASRHAMQIPELIAEVLHKLTERDLGWDPENLGNASLVNRQWLDLCRPILLRELNIGPGISTSLAPDTRVQRLLALVGQNSYNRHVKHVFVQFSRQRERARRAAPGRGPASQDVASLLSLTPWVQQLKVSHLEPQDLVHQLSEPLAAFADLQIVSLNFSPLNQDTYHALYESVSNLLHRWSKLSKLQLTMPFDGPLAAASEPAITFPHLPNLRHLTLRYVGLSDKLLAQLLDCTPHLQELIIWRPELHLNTEDGLLQALAKVQTHLRVLGLSGLPDAVGPKVVARGLPELRDLSLEAKRLDRGSIVDHLPTLVEMLRLVSWDQKPITLAFVAKVKRRLGKPNELQALKLPMLPAPAKIHRKEMWAACQKFGVLLEMGSEQLALA